MLMISLQVGKDNERRGEKKKRPEEKIKFMSLFLVGVCVFMLWGACLWCLLPKQVSFSSLRLCLSPFHCSVSISLLWIAIHMQSERKYIMLRVHKLQHTKAFFFSVLVDRPSPEFRLCFVCVESKGSCICNIHRHMLVVVLLLLPFTE